MKLIGSHSSPFVRKARIVLAEKRIDYDFVVDNPRDGASRVSDSIFALPISIGAPSIRA